MSNHDREFHVSASYGGPRNAESDPVQIHAGAGPSVICVGTGRDGTTSLYHVILELFGRDGSRQAMHEYKTREFYDTFCKYRETEAEVHLAELVRLVAECRYDAIVGNGYASVLPLFAERHGHRATLVHLRRADRDACVKSLMANCERFPDTYGYYSTASRAIGKRMAAFHFGETTRAEWDDWPLQRKFEWFYDKTHCLIDDCKSAFRDYVEITTENLSSENTRRLISRICGADDLLPNPRHMNQHWIAPGKQSDEDVFKLQWLMGRLDLHSLTTDDVYAVDYFLNKFTTWTGYQIKGASELGPVRPRSHEQVSLLLDRAHAILSKALTDLGELKSLVARPNPLHETSAPPTPQSMLQLNVPRLSARTTPDRGFSLAEQAKAIQSGLGSRAANQFLLDRLGYDFSREHGESYFAEAFDYHLGLLYGHLGQPERMATHIGSSHTMPSMDDDQLFSDHVNVSHALRARQQAAIQRGMPPILAACMPRSASATLTHTIARLLDLPVLHLSIGWFPDYYLAPSWVDAFLQGGAITQDHFSPSEFNLGVLASRGPRDIFVLARDPRAAARSRIHFLAPPGSRDDRMIFEARFCHECIDDFIPWLQGWIDCARRGGPLRIHFVTYRQISRDLPGVIGRICSILQQDYPALAPYRSLRAVEEVRTHFVSGDDEAWRAEIGEPARERVWSACTPDIRALLALEP
jgi:hypothetical protein